jgi:hypothetical protein
MTENTPPLLFDYIGAIMAFAAFTFAIGLCGGMVAGFSWGSMRTSGDTIAVQDLCERYNALQEENEALKRELKYGLSTD